jgi:hypothetical protein
MTNINSRKEKKEKLTQENYDKKNEIDNMNEREQDIESIICFVWIFAWVISVAAIVSFTLSHVAPLYYGIQISDLIICETKSDCPTDTYFVEFFCELHKCHYKLDERHECITDAQCEGLNNICHPDEFKCINGAHFVKEHLKSIFKKDSLKESSEGHYLGVTLVHIYAGIFLIAFISMIYSLSIRKN